MATHNLYKSHLPSCSYVFLSGKAAYFLQGRYNTDIESEITELENEVKLHHPHIYIDAAEVTVDTDALDPISQIKKKAIAEYIASQAKSNNLSNDRGNYEHGKILGGIANTASIGSGAADSSSGQEGVDLSALKVRMNTPIVKAGS